MSRIDLIIHPVRLRILQTIGNDTLTTQEIADRMSDTPKSSIYRHLRLLRRGGIIQVAETRLVNGIQEKTYQLGEAPMVGPTDMANLTAEQHVNYFTTYLMTVLREFEQYVLNRERQNQPIDFVADRVGYTEATFYATEAEFDQVQQRIQQALLPLLGRQAENGRLRRKLAIITHPMLQIEANQDEARGNCP